MTMTTSEVTCTGDDWAVLAATATAAFLQIRGDGPIIVAVAAAKPDAASTVGVRLMRGATEGLNLTGLTSGTDIVYGKCMNAESELVTVLKTAS